MNLKSKHNHSVLWFKALTFLSSPQAWLAFSVLIWMYSSTSPGKATFFSNQVNSLLMLLNFWHKRPDKAGGWQGVELAVLDTLSEGDQDRCDTWTFQWHVLLQTIFSASFPPSPLPQGLSRWLRQVPGFLHVRGFLSCRLFRLQGSGLSAEAKNYDRVMAAVKYQREKENVERRKTGNRM